VVENSTAVSEAHWWLPEFLDRVQQVMAETGFGTVSVEIVEGKVKFLTGTWRKQRSNKTLDSNLL